MSITAAHADELRQATAWADTLAARVSVDGRLTIGVVGSSPMQLDNRVLEQLVALVGISLENLSERKRLLVVHLDVFPSRDLDRAADQPATIPVAKRSLLGPWSEVNIPMPVGTRASWSLEQIPVWLPIWKRAFELVLVNLGPIDMVPSRIVGRFCNDCYAVLGPSTSASADWIKKQIDWHQQSGSMIRGTLLGLRSQAA